MAEEDETTYKRVKTSIHYGSLEESERQKTATSEAEATQAAMAAGRINVTEGLSVNHLLKESLKISTT